ncbi:hypothetical protein GCM10029976_041940 [Kribbella albertanoniae]
MRQRRAIHLLPFATRCEMQPGRETASANLYLCPAPGRAIDISLTSVDGTPRAGDAASLGFLGIAYGCSEHPLSRR